MTVDLSIKLYLVSVKLNQHANYSGQREFISNVIVLTRVVDWTTRVLGDSTHIEYKALHQLWRQLVEVVHVSTKLITHIEYKALHQLYDDS